MKIGYTQDPDYEKLRGILENIADPIKDECTNKMQGIFDMLCGQTLKKLLS